MNQFFNTKNIAREALPILESNLVFPELIYKDYSEDISKQGDLIQVRKPPVYSANEFEGAIEIQDIKESEVLVKLDKIADVSVELSAKEMALNAEDFTKQVIEPAMVAIAEKINADGLALYKDIPYTCGESGTAPSTLSDLAGGAKALNDNKAPISARSAVWNTEAMANFQTLPALVNAEKCGSTEALKEGAIGRVFGVDHYFSQQVPQHTAGNYSGSATATSEGDGMILISGSTNGKLLAGDILHIGTGSYVVREDVTMGEPEVVVKIYPSLAAEDERKAVTAAGSHAANLMFQKNAFGFVSRPLEAARGADSYVTSYNGISVRVTMDYNITTKKQTLSIDTLYGFKTLYPELAVRVLG